MPIIYTNLAAAQLPVDAANTWTRIPGVKITGEILYREAIYTVPASGAAVTADLLRICRLPAGFILLPNLCKIVSEGMGTAFNIASIGEVAEDGTTADNSANRHSAAINATAANAFDFVYAAQSAGLTGYTTVRPMWLTATLGTITALTVGRRIRFIIAGAVGV